MEIEAHNKQREFLASDAPNVVFQGGAGSGKTWTGVLKCLLLALGNPGSRGMFVAPSHPQLEQAVMPHLLALADTVGLLATWQWNRAKNIITLPNESVFFLRSATDPGSLLGADLAWAVGDEVALWKQDAYRYLMGRLRQPGYPHQAAFTFTPKGRNWAWDTLGTPREGLHIVKVTTFDNPYLERDFHERLHREYGEGSQFWRQEVQGEYVAWEGLVYPQFDVERHVADPPPGTHFIRVLLGVDWGWTNPGVILVLGMDPHGNLWVLDETYETERDLSWWGNEAIRIMQRWGATSAYCDPSEPGNIAGLQSLGIAAYPANNAVIPGITDVGSRITGGHLYVAPHCTHLIAEIGMYCWKSRADGTIRRDEPEKQHDHAMDALRYGTLGFWDQPPQVVTIEDLLPGFTPRRIGAAR